MFTSLLRAAMAFVGPCGACARTTTYAYAGSSVPPWPRVARDAW